MTDIVTAIAWLVGSAFALLVVGLIVVLAGTSGVRATLDAAIVIALVGFLGTVLAAVGVLRMPDVFTRMQASTKASTLGLVSCSCSSTSGTKRTNWLIVRRYRRDNDQEDPVRHRSYESQP